MQSAEQSIQFAAQATAGLTVATPQLFPTTVGSLGVSHLAGHNANSLLFVDSGVQDYQSLLATVEAGTEVHLLDSTRNAVTQITQTLRGREGIGSLHIVSHGAAGGIQLGDDWLNLYNVQAYASQLEAWKSALTDNADILLYGCNVAGGSSGQAFVQALSQETGADVGASEDLTGSATLGGDWTLEYHTGTIETTAFSSHTYDQVLYTAKVVSDSNGRKLVIDGDQSKTINAFMLTLTNGGSDLLIQDALNSFDGGNGVSSVSGRPGDAIVSLNSFDSLEVELGGSSNPDGTAALDKLTFDSEFVFKNVTINSGNGEHEVNFNKSLSLKGGDLIVNAETINVRNGVTLSTRQIAGNDYLNALSTGNSGNIRFTGKSVTLTSANLLTHTINARGSSSVFRDGDISIKVGSAAQGIGLLLPTLDKNQVKIELDRATLKGKNIDLSALVDHSRIFDDAVFEQGGNVGEAILKQLGNIKVVAGVAVSLTSAEILIQQGSKIDAVNLTVNAAAQSQAKVDTYSYGLGVGVGVADSNAKVVVAKDTTITTLGNLSLTTTAKNTLSVNASPLVAALDVASGAVAVSTSRMSSIVQVANGSTLNVGGKLDVQAFTEETNTTKAKAVASGQGQLGVAVAVFDSDSKANALVDGNVTAQGDITIKSEDRSIKNETVAESGVGTGLVGAVKAAVKDTLLDIIRITFGVQFGSAAQSGSKPVGLSASVAVATDRNEAIARIGDGAQVKSKAGSLAVNARIETTPTLSSSAIVDSFSANELKVSKLRINLESLEDYKNTKKYAGSASVSVGKFTNNAQAYIGAEAVVDSQKALTVDSETLIPNKLPQLPSKLLAFQEYGKLVQNPNFKSQSAATGGGEVGVAGSVNILNLENTSAAYIARDAKINQDVTLQSALQKVIVKGLSKIDAVYLSGPYGLSSEGSTAGVGGSYLEVNTKNQVSAVIRDGVQLQANTLEVDATTSGVNVLLAASGGKAGDYGVNGVFVLAQTANDTIAQIDDGATINVGSADNSSFIRNTFASVLVNAQDNSQIINIAGGVAIAKNVGFGASVAISKVTRNTQAIIGNRNSGSEADKEGVVKLTGSTKVIVSAENSGSINSYSLAGAVTTGVQTTPDPKKVKEASKGGGSYGISLSGDVSWNDVNDQAQAYVKDTKVQASNVIELTAKNSTQINALAGAFAISTSVDNKSAGLAGSYTVNTITGKTYAFVNRSTIEGGLSLDARTTDTIKALAAGGSVAPSPTSYTVAGSVTNNEISNDTSAYINDSNITATKVLSVSAQDVSTMQSNAGGVSVGGKLAVGAAVALSTIRNRTTAKISDSTVNNPENSTTLSAFSNNTVESNAVAIGVAIQGLAAPISVSINEIGTTTEALATGNKTQVNAAVGSISLSARDQSKLQAIAGGLGIGGKASLGASVAYNQINNKVKAAVEDATLITSSKGISFPGKSISISAAEEQTITTVAVAGTGAGAAAGAAGVAINLIGNNVAAYANKAKLISNQSVAITAESNNTVKFYGGAIAGAGGTAIGGSAGVNNLKNVTLAYISNSTVSAKGSGSAIEVPTATGNRDRISGLAVVAASRERVELWAGSLAGGGKGGVAAALSANLVADQTHAYIENSKINENNTGASAAQTVQVKAFNTTDIDVKAGGVGIGGVAGFAGTGDATLLNNTTRAYINNALVINALGNIEVTSSTTEKVNSLVIAGAFSLGGGFAGSTSVLELDNTNAAFISGSTVKTGAALKVNAIDQVDLKDFAGAVGVGVAVGAGVGVVITSISNKTYADIYNSTIETGSTEVIADADQRVEINSVSVGGAKYGAAGGTIVVNSIAADTRASISEANGGQTRVTSNQDVKVTAKNTSTINTTLGAGAGALGVAFGASVNVNTINNLTVAAIQSGTETTATKGTVEVTATAQEIVFPTVGALSGGLVAGVAGTVSIVNVGVNLLTAEQEKALQKTKQTIKDLLTERRIGGALGNDAKDKTATTAQYQTNSELNKLSADSLFGSAATEHATRAYINNDAVVKAGGNITINATDTTVITPVTGSVAGGAVAVGGSASLVQLKRDTFAAVGYGATLTATGAISIAANGNARVDGQATAGSGSVIAGLGAAYSTVHSQNNATAIIGSDVAINQAKTLSVAANTTSTLAANGNGVSRSGAAAAGLAHATVLEEGVTQAFLGDRVKVGSATDPNKTVDNLQVNATSTNHLIANSTASSGGIGVAGNGSEATATGSPTVKVWIGKDSTINVRQRVGITARAIGAIAAEANGVSFSGVGSVGKSSANTIWKPNLEATVGEKVNLKAGENLYVGADSEMTRTPGGINATAKATSSAGSLLGSEVGSEANVTITTQAKTTIGKNAQLSAENDLYISGSAYNETQSKASGDAFGLISQGTTKSTSTINNTTTVLPASDVTLKAKNIIIQADVDNRNTSPDDGTYVDKGFNATGKAGGALAKGGNRAASTLNNTIEVGLGARNTATATDQLVLKGDHTADIRAKAKQVSAGLATKDKAFSDINITSNTNTFVGQDSTINAKQVYLGALSKNTSAFAKADTESTAAGAGTQSEASVDANVFTNVLIGKLEVPLRGFTLLGPFENYTGGKVDITVPRPFSGGSVDVESQQKSVRTNADAYSQFNGALFNFTGSLDVKAKNNLNAQSTIDGLNNIKPGTLLFGKAEVPFVPGGYIQNPVVSTPYSFTTKNIIREGRQGRSSSP